MENQITSNRLSAAPQFTPAPQILNYGPVRKLIEQDRSRAGLDCDMEDSFPLSDGYALFVKESWPAAESLVLHAPKDIYLDIAPPPLRRSRMTNNFLKFDGRSR